MYSYLPPSQIKDWIKCIFEAATFLEFGRFEQISWNLAAFYKIQIYSLLSDLLFNITKIVQV